MQSNQELQVTKHSIDSEAAKAMPYEVGSADIIDGVVQFFNPYVGAPRLNWNLGLSRSLDALDGKVHFVRGDGSCWARALWQCVFSQIFADDDKFHAFIERVANPKSGYEINDQLAKEAIFILYQLKNRTFKERIEYLNHPNVENSLIFFMRDVAGECVLHKDKSSKERIQQIKTNKHQYGGDEIRYFIQYFGLENHTIFKNANGQWQYDFTDTSGKVTRTLLSELQPRPPSCLFPVNDSHYEFISFGEYVAENEAANDNKTIKDLAIILGSLFGSIALGAGIGALVGSFALPLVGTAAGAMIGALLGSGIGLFVAGFQGLVRNRLFGGVNVWVEKVGAGFLASLGITVIASLVGTLIAPGLGTLIGASVGLVAGLATMMLTTWAFSTSNSNKPIPILFTEEDFRDVGNTTSPYFDPALQAKPSGVGFTAKPLNEIFSSAVTSKKDELEQEVNESTPLFRKQ